MIVNGFIEPVTRTPPMEYAVEWSRLIELQMEAPSADRPLAPGRRDDDSSPRPSWTGCLGASAKHAAAAARQLSAPAVVRRLDAVVAGDVLGLLRVGAVSWAAARP